MGNMSKGEKGFIIAAHVLLILLSLAIIIPVASVVVNSFVSAAEVARRGQFILWPEEFDFSAYNMLFNSDRIYSGYLNTLFVTIMGTALSMILTISLAYPLSKRICAAAMPFWAWSSLPCCSTPVQSRISC